MTRTVATQSLIELGQRIATELLCGQLTFAKSDAEEYRTGYLALKAGFLVRGGPLPSPDDPRLSPRQRQVVALAAIGQKDRAIGRSLGIGYRHGKDPFAACPVENGDIPMSAGMILPTGSPLVQFEITKPFAGQSPTVIWVDRSPDQKRNYKEPNCACLSVFAVDDAEAIKLLEREGSASSKKKIAQVKSGAGRIYVCLCVGRFVE